MKRFLIIPLSFILLITASPIQAAVKNGRLEADTRDFRLRLFPRSPEQVAAFYEARGFPKAALKQLETMCFFTVGFLNRRNDIIWLDLADWRFEADGTVLQRFHRNDLKARWQAMGLPMALQSTFRWTLMPEKLDFRPKEHEGGNIVLPRTDKPFTLHARFKTGANKQGKILQTSIKNILCAKNP